MLGNLYKTKCYLCGATENYNGTNWRNYIKEQLKETGISFLDPYNKPFFESLKEDEDARKNYKSLMKKGEFQKIHTFMKHIRADDLRCVDLSDFLIVHINPEVPTWGTVEELTTGNRRKCPIYIVVVGGKKKCPLWVMGMVPPQYIFDNLEELICHLKNIDSGKISLDSSRWKLLKHEYR